MLALSIRQPWAWAIFFASKDVENRIWRPPVGMRGRRILIHASKGGSRTQYDHDVEQVLWARSCARLLRTPVPYFAEAPRGCIVGAVTIVGWTRSSESVWFGGPWGWQLSNAVALKIPVACRGERGLFRIPDDVAAAVRAAAA